MDSSFFDKEAEEENKGVLFKSNYVCPEFDGRGIVTAGKTSVKGGGHMIRHPRVKNILLVIVLIAFIGIPSQVCSQASQLAQSFSQYFCPQVLRAVDAMMKTRFNCQPDGLWKIWSYGFYRKYKGAERRFEVILNWDGMYYIKDASAFSSEADITGDWTLLK